MIIVTILIIVIKCNYGKNIDTGRSINIGNNDTKNCNNSNRGNTSNDNNNNLGKGISWKLHLACYAPCVHAWAGRGLEGLASI